MLQWWEIELVNSHGTSGYFLYTLHALRFLCGECFIR